MQPKLIPCGAEHFEELISFIVRLNSEDTHHIGFFGEGEADVRASLAECVVPPAEGFHLAYAGDQLVGVFGVDADPEVNRAWLFGPLIEHAEWQSLADDLYAASLKVIPSGVGEQDLFFDVHNVNVKEFAERHAFLSRSENAIMTLARAQYRKLSLPPNSFSVIDFQPSFFDAFEQMHNELFPTTYFTARQIVERINESRRLFLGLENGILKGYHFCKVESDARLGYVDFIGVDRSVRGRGLGASLLTAGMDWMLSFAETDKISLTVNADNAAAIKLYEKYGFITERVMCGYRKKGLDV